MFRSRFFFVLILFFFISFFSVDAQTTWKEEQINLPFFKKISLEVKSNTFYKDIDAEFPFTSIAIGVPANVVFPDDLKLEGNGIKSTLIKENEHSENPDLKLSELIITESISSQTFSIFSGNFSGKLTILLHYAPPLKTHNLPLPKRQTDSCEKPASIPISSWRQGLPAPTVKPQFTSPIEHVIIHHSAGSNSDTDYTKAVRNIYLYHTQSNGWDDIGYNYLVAPNGDIYDGRDPQGVAAHDYILGAHFCGKNSNTMGICMLGDLSLKSPSTKAVESLKLMLSWKLKKDNLNPIDSILHPKNNPSAYLVGTIAGHRNGCATECPGDSMYALIPGIKKDVNRIISGCGPASIFEENTDLAISTINIFPNPAAASFYIENTSANIQNLQLINTMGQITKVIRVNAGEKVTINASLLPKGLYLIKSTDNENSAAIKMLIQH